jgi:DnaJ-class molecular chaperone
MTRSGRMTVQIDIPEDMPVCPLCDGTGDGDLEPCPKCDGDGYEMDWCTDEEEW